MASTEKMKKCQERAISPEDIKKFCCQLSTFPDSSLRRIYEYYRDDLIYILENLNPHSVLSELKSWDVLNVEVKVWWIRFCWISMDTH
ncbi:uncharacterized protein LOC143988996 isoform X2 [Lithobates pipiens]